MSYRTPGLWMLACVVLPIFVAMPSEAQPPAPSAQQIINALDAPAVQTRGLRNLKVAPSQPSPTASTTAPTPPVATETAASPAPSISMSITFDFNSAHIRHENTAALTNLVAALNSETLQDSRFRIEGHTDAKGRPEYNMRLSAQRANAVMSWLTQNGIKANRLTAVGLGSNDLADPSNPESAANRRVRIVRID